MTKILTRYIARRFLVTITAAFVMILTLIFMIDIVELLREAGKTGGVPAYVIAWLALLRLPAFSEVTLPFAVLVGAIGAFLLLSRGSELTIARASGMSAWQFTLPGVLVALLYGIVSVTLYNPLAAAASAQAERQSAITFGNRDMNSLAQSQNGAQWLRQDGQDGQSIISAQRAADRGLLLSGVMVLLYDPEGHFPRAGRCAIGAAQRWLLGTE